MAKPPVKDLLKAWHYVINESVGDAKLGPLQDLEVGSKRIFPIPRIVTACSAKTCTYTQLLIDTDPAGGKEMKGVLS